MHDSNVSKNNFSVAFNGTSTETYGKTYVFSTIESSILLTLILLLVTVGLVGLVGNILIICFLKKKKKNKSSVVRVCSFEKNFNVYMKSLAISDVLSVVISIPLLCVHLLFDVLQRSWGCKIARYFKLLFPSITIYNLLFISIERYFSTRDIPRTFSHSNVKKLVFAGWLMGCLTIWIPAATFDGMMYDLNETHYTVVCRYDNQYLPFRIVLLTFTTLQFTVPIVIMIILNILLMKTVWKRRKVIFDVQRDNGIKIMERKTSFHRTCFIVALTFAFIFPYFFTIAQIAYNNITGAKIGFQTDLIIRAVGSLLILSNPAVDFVLYLVQMKDFRVFLKKLFTSKCGVNKQTPATGDNLAIELHYVLDHEGVTQKGVK